MTGLERPLGGSAPGVLNFLPAGPRAVEKSSCGRAWEARPQESSPLRGSENRPFTDVRGTAATRPCSPRPSPRGGPSPPPGAGCRRAAPPRAAPPRPSPREREREREREQGQSIFFAPLSKEWEIRKASGGKHRGVKVQLILLADERMILHDGSLQSWSRLQRGNNAWLLRNCTFRM